MAPRRPSAKNSSEIPANTAKYSVKRVAHLLNVNGASTEATPSPGHPSCRPDRRPDGCQPDTRWQWWPNTHSFYPCNSFFLHILPTSLLWGLLRMSLSFGLCTYLMRGLIVGHVAGPTIHLFRVQIWRDASSSRDVTRGVLVIKRLCKSPSSLRYTILCINVFITNLFIKPK